MEILKFGDNPSPNRSNNNQRKPAAMIVAGVLVAMMGMSTTLAGTISIGTNSRVEFGQGIVSTAACDSAITVSPSTTFNTSGAGLYADTFTVTALTFGGVAGGASAAADNCIGKYFTVKAYAGDSLLTFDGASADGTFLKFRIPESSADTSSSWSAITAGSGSSGSFQNTSGWTGASGTVQVYNFNLSNTVTRFTVESSDS